MEKKTLVMEQNKVVDNLNNRIECYFSETDCLKRKELKKYLKKYFELREKYYLSILVPKIFVLQYGFQGVFATAMSWGFNYPTIFPPTDIVYLTSCIDDTENKVEVIGYAKMEDLIAKLDPYLADIDNFVFTKKTSTAYEDFFKHSEEIDYLIEKFPKPLENMQGIKKIDIIPSVEEEEMYDAPDRS